MKLFYILMILIFSTTIFSNELKDYSFTFQDEDLIIALKFDEEPDEEAFNLKNPFRLILKFKNTTLSNKIKAKNKINNEIINEIMTMQYARNGITNSKLIISLKKEVAYTVDKFGTRLLIILKNAKSNDKIAKHIEKNEKAETEKTKKTELEKNKNLIESINYQYDNEDLIFSIKMKKEAKVKAFELSEPFRIFLDINGVELNEKLKKQYSYKDDYLKSLYINKMSRNGKAKVRLSLFLKEKKSYSVETINNIVILTIKGAKKIKTLASSKNNEPEEVLSNLVEDINYEYDNEDLIFSIKLKKEAKYKDFELSEPFRIFLDIEDTGVKFNSKLKEEMKYNDEFIKKLLITKMKRNGKTRIRMSLFLKEKKPYTIENINNNIILIIRGAKKLKTFVENTVDTDKTKDLNTAKSSVNKKKDNISELIDYNYSDNSLLIALKLPKETDKLKYYHLFKPFRVILDLKDMKLIDLIKEEKNYNDNYIKNIKFIKYKKSGKINTKVILSFNEYKPFEIEQINKTILITLSNVNLNNNNISKLEEENELKTDEDVEEVISFKKSKKTEKNEKIEKHKETKVVISKSNFVSTKQNKLNKVVFKLHKKGARVNIKTQDFASYETSIEGKVFTLTLNNAVFGSRMASLSLNTEFFKKIVKKIIPKRSGKNLIIKIILSKSKSPKINQKKNLIELTF